MKITKYISRIRWVQWLLFRLIAGYINLVFYTNRWTIIGNETLLPYNDPAHSNAIFAFWHGRLLVMPKFKPTGRPHHAIISIHSDGELIARAIEFFNVHLIRGSSRKGGIGALIEARKILHRGDNVVITPDGPKGPRMRINGNVLALAKMTGCPVIPVTFSCSRAIVLRSWDRFLLALPFGKAIIICGTPITAAPECDEETMRTLTYTLEDELNRITREADELVGREPVMPAKRIRKVF